jgi:1-acyl-sn-glycerol-3-phosphate acyltransferase
MLRAVFVVFGVAIFLFLVGPFCVLYALIRRSPDILYSAGRAGSRLGLCLGGVKVVVRGRENIEVGRTCLFLANHQSYCDPPALFMTIPRNVRLILKKELRKLPLLGLIMEMGGFVFIDRKDRVQSVSGMKRASGSCSRAFVSDLSRRHTDAHRRAGPFKKGPLSPLKRAPPSCPSLSRAAMNHAAQSVQVNPERLCLSPTHRDQRHVAG